MTFAWTQQDIRDEKKRIIVERTPRCGEPPEDWKPFVVNVRAATSLTNEHGQQLFMQDEFTLDVATIEEGFMILDDFVAEKDRELKERAMSEFRRQQLMAPLNRQERRVLEAKNGHASRITT